MQHATTIGKLLQHRQSWLGSKQLEELCKANRDTTSRNGVGVNVQVEPPLASIYRELSNPYGGAGVGPNGSEPTQNQHYQLRG